jgi:hypothetical protein
VDFKRKKFPDECDLVDEKHYQFDDINQRNWSFMLRTHGDSPHNVPLSKTTKQTGYYIIKG